MGYGGTKEEMHFNSQPHEEADLPIAFICSAILVISTRSLTRRLTINHSSCIHCCHISTRSLTRRLTKNYLTLYVAVLISTRSLTRRLTLTSSTRADVRYISTRSLTRRLTMLSIHTNIHVVFQLAASRGG